MRAYVSDALRRPSSIYTPMMVTVEFDQAPQHTAEQEIRDAFLGIAHVSVFGDNTIRDGITVWRLTIGETAPDIAATREAIRRIAQDIAAKG